MTGKENDALGTFSQTMGANAEAEINKTQAQGSSASLPREIYVLPIFARPVMPSQICPVRVDSKWEETISKIAADNEHLFAVFSMGDSPIGREIKKEDFPHTGTLVRLLQAKTDPSGVHFICEGLCRTRIDKWTSFEEFSRALVSYPQDLYPKEGSRAEVNVKAYAMSLVSAMQELLPLSPLYTEEMRQYLMRFNQNDPSMLADCAASITTAPTEKLLEVLDTEDVFMRLKISSELIKKELRAAKLQDRINGTVNDRLSKRQKNYILREQLKEIQKELGTKADDRSTEAAMFETRMKKLSPPDQIKKRFDEELKKLKILETGSPEYAVTRNYLDVLTTIPWGKNAVEHIDLEKARKILDADHEGLKDVKERIIEFLALGAMRGSTSGAIMLLSGPPGVGKTSVGRSVAKALGRPFFRLSLGGVDDEAVIKGHRRTYIGSMPGKMVQALRECQVMNPVIMLDEIDKLSHSYQGDPASSLLETLDPEQNSGFLDNYLDEKLDLSGCLFICTSNTNDSIPEPLLDRMDPIMLSGYIASEKLKIAKKHLLPRALKDAGIKKSQFKISDTVLSSIIEGYARESGVRSLERALKKLVRKAAVRLVSGEESVTVKAEELQSLLGPAPFKKEAFIKGKGVVTGLAWTSAGGATLEVEAQAINSQESGLTLTGRLGDVMKESAQIAFNYIRANIERLSPQKKDFFKKTLVHLHVPEGATPKDGPSAGITMASALLSLCLNKAPKDGFAMTGELSLTGKVLAIGGLREKTIAARRMGIKDIICPKANEDDLSELPDEVKEGMHFHLVESYDEVAALLFDKTSN